MKQCGDDKQTHNFDKENKNKVTSVLVRKRDNQGKQEDLSCWLA
jgi:hypothetical protein